MSNPPAFNARAIFSWRPDRRYRAYAEHGSLYFIKTGGQLSGQHAANHFGLVGVLVHALLKKRLEAKAVLKQRELDAKGPQQLLATHKHNFVLRNELVRAVKVSLPPFWKLHGPCIARVEIEPLQGNPQTLQFDKPEELQAALPLLQIVFAEKLKTELRWDETKKKYVKQYPAIGLKLNLSRE